MEHRWSPGITKSVQEKQQNSRTRSAQPRPVSPRWVCEPWNWINHSQYTVYREWGGKGSDLWWGRKRHKRTETPLFTGKKSVDNVLTWTKWRDHNISRSLRNTEVNTRKGKRLKKLKIAAEECRLGVGKVEKCTLLKNNNPGMPE